MSLTPTIIAVGFSRAKSLSRLLDSLNRAEYTDEVSLIISLDGEATIDVIELVRKFEFKHGTKHIEIHPRNLGLRNHILWAGDQSKKYGSVIVLEDDLAVDKYFYGYAVSALKKYIDQPRVAGLALYSPRRNEFANLPFDPFENNLSSYFMQVPCSWGQVWTQSQWSAFRDWYDLFLETGVIEDVDLPDAVKEWPESSWKKYFAAYLLLNDRYFSYPYRSYTTNCADSGGTHMPNETTLYQVPLADQSRRFETIVHGDFTESSVIYDAFMEPDCKRIARMLGVNPDSIEVDIYGIKPGSQLSKREFTLTSKVCEEPIWAAYLTLRPVEISIHYSSKIQFGDKMGKSSAPILFFARSENVVPKRNQYLELSKYYSDQEFYTWEFLYHYVYGGAKKLISKVRNWL